jgi:hypothetical protein
MHKGFKCLDIPTSRVYISRDIIFDENIFPFANLHSNAGARLRSEILLLPPTLCSPESSHKGGEIPINHMVTVSNPDSNFSVLDSAPNIAENRAEASNKGAHAGAEIGIDTGAEIGIDSGAAPLTSVPDSGTVPGTIISDIDSGAAPLISVPAADSGTIPGVALSGDQRHDDAESPQESNQVSESSTQRSDVVIPDVRPRTRLQGGIHKPKVYTDDTIRYSCFTSTGEPQNLEEAMENKNWKQAMDLEYSTLINNKTW